MSPNGWRSYDIDYYGSYFSSSGLIVGATAAIGHLSGGFAFDTYGVRPVISLKSCVTVANGDGTASSPYTVSVDSTCSSAEN